MKEQQYEFKIQKGKNLLDGFRNIYDAEIADGLIKLPDVYYFFQHKGKELALVQKRVLKNKESTFTLDESMDLKIELDRTQNKLFLKAGDRILKDNNNETLYINPRNIFCKKNIVDELEKDETKIFSLKPVKYQILNKDNTKAIEYVGIYDKNDLLGHLSDFHYYANDDGLFCSTFSGLKGGVDTNITNDTIIEECASGLCLSTKG